jgi:hypothetical protein
VPDDLRFAHIDSGYWHNMALSSECMLCALKTGVCR